MNKLIRTSTLTIALGAIIPPVMAQPTCENVVIEHIGYNALNVDLIDVRAFYDGSDCITYPSFILFDEAGDTLGIETVNYFCVGFGSAQTHSMLLHADAVVPTGTFNARLELFSGFGDTLYCSWDLNDLFLCPPVGCQQAEIYITNTGMLEAFEAYWWIQDEDEMLVDQGNFLVGDDMATHFDTTCLPPGNYQIGFSPFSPIDEEFVIGITPSYQQSIGTNTVLEQSQSPWELSFAWYAPCVEGANAISEREERDVRVFQEGGFLHLSDPLGSALGTVQLFAANGSMARSLQARSDRTSMDLNELNSGLYVVRVIAANGRSISRSILIP